MDCGSWAPTGLQFYVLVNMAWFTGSGRGKGSKLKGASAPHSRVSQQQEELVRKNLCIELFNRAAVETRFFKNSKEVVYLDKLDKGNREGAIEAFLRFLDTDSQVEKFLETLRKSVELVHDDNQVGDQREQHKELIREWRQLSGQGPQGGSQRQRHRSNKKVLRSA